MSDKKLASFQDHLDNDCEPADVDTSRQNILGRAIDDNGDSVGWVVVEETDLGYESVFVKDLNDRKTYYRGCCVATPVAVCSFLAIEGVKSIEWTDRPATIAEIMPDLP